MGEQGPTMSRKVFDVLSSVAQNAPRLGRLTVPNRKPIDTPNFMAVTSRGAIPHITQDNMQHTEPTPIYMALEDFIEKKQPPIYKTPESEARRLHSFTALPQDLITVMAARRCPAVTTPVGNGAKYVATFTSTGFRNITIPEYTDAIKCLQPDIAVPLADLFHTSAAPPPKKLLRMADRTEAWNEDIIAKLRETPQLIFAPTLAIEHPMQWSHLKFLAEEAIDSLSGLAIYGTSLLPDIADSYPSLSALPKISFEVPKSPQDLLRQVSLGIDICTVPFMNAISDAGIAMTFTFPSPEHSSTSPLPLGIDMWSTDNVTAVEPLQERCSCFACKTHHRAYIHHLLNAKEMLGWTLLQIHNHHVINNFFANVRSTLQKGQEQFEEASSKFQLIYDTTFPHGTGQRPRARGYHFKSDGGDDKINQSPWQELDGQDGQAMGAK